MIDVNHIRATLQDRLRELEATDSVDMGRSDYDFLTGQITAMLEAIEVVDAAIQKEKEDHVHKTKLRLEREEFIMSKGRKL